MSNAETNHIAAVASQEFAAEQSDLARFYVAAAARSPEHRAYFEDMAAHHQGIADRAYQRARYEAGVEVRPTRAEPMSDAEWAAMFA